MHCMIDLETLGTKPGSAILTIGAVKFDEDEIRDEFYQNVDLDSCTEVGLEVDGSTFEWWLQQTDEAQQEITGGVPLEDPLRRFSVFYEDCDQIWAKPPTMDVAVLEYAYGAVGLEVPWEYNGVRDLYTAREFCSVDREDFDGEPHVAVDDARYQAREVQKILRTQ